MRIKKENKKIKKLNLLLDQLIFPQWFVNYYARYNFPKFYSSNANAHKRVTEEVWFDELDHCLVKRKDQSCANGCRVTSIFLCKKCILSLHSKFLKSFYFTKQRKLMFCNVLSQPYNCRCSCFDSMPQGFFAI